MRTGDSDEQPCPGDHAVAKSGSEKQPSRSIAPVALMIISKRGGRAGLPQRGYPSMYSGRKYIDVINVMAE